MVRPLLLTGDMKQLITVLVALGSMVGVASASTDDGFVAVGTLVGTDAAPYATVALEAGRPISTHLAAHLQLAGGTTFSYGDADTYATARGGLEATGCLASSLCAFAGLDLGVRHEEFAASRYDELKTTTGAIAVPRAGIDVGSASMRFRATLGVVIEPTAVVGGDLSLAVAYRF
ncbi:MAG: hypothetical protein NT062_37200 [Proteobacteria bacterium]|nr:hypothetical protein [Pseudomonadota bacterium]